MRARAPKLLAAVAVAAVGALLALGDGRGEAPVAAPVTEAAPTVAAVPTAPPAPPVAAAVPAAPPPAPASRAPAEPLAAATPASEEEHVARLREVVDADPAAAVALAEDGEARFPGGTYSDERAYHRMRALVHLGEIGVARAAAGEFFERHPESPLGRDVFRLTGMRPPPVMGPRT